MGVDLTARQGTVERTANTATVITVLDTLDLGAMHLDHGGTVAERADPECERSGPRIALIINAALFIAELSFGLISWSTAARQCRSSGLRWDGSRTCG